MLWALLAGPIGGCAFRGEHEELRIIWTRDGEETEIMKPTDVELDQVLEQLHAEFLAIATELDELRAILGLNRRLVEDLEAGRSCPDPPR